MNKSHLTNFIALLITIGGYYSPVHSDLIFSVGIFALSGGVTNWLAVHMLFEKVPLLYGSGVIPRRFEEFKGAIKVLIVTQFFTREHIEKFFHNEGDNIVEKIDFDHVFQGLSDAIADSSLGGMLTMVGGKKALEPLREPVKEKLKDIIAELADKSLSEGSDVDLSGELIVKIEQIIDNRLAELTPENVKHIVQEMIHQHLGWLVVWGGIFGGAIGLAVGLLT